MTSSSPTLPTHDEIAQLAYEIWQNRGCPDGQDQELWLEAERQLNQRASNSPFSKNDDLASHTQRENESETTREHPTGPQPSPAVAAVKEAFATSQKKKD